MLAKAVAHHTTAAFIRVVGSEFVQKYLGEVGILLSGDLVLHSCILCTVVSSTVVSEHSLQECTAVALSDQQSHCRGSWT